jgi:hypothetical protein
VEQHKSNENRWAYRSRNRKREEDEMLPTVDKEGDSLLSKVKK